MLFLVLVSLLLFVKELINRAYIKMLIKRKEKHELTSLPKNKGNTYTSY